MKKYLSILFIAVFALVLTGCGKGKSLTCTIASDEIDLEVKMIFKSDAVDKIEYTSIKTFDSKDQAKSFADSYKAFNNEDSIKIKADGTKVRITNTIDISDSKETTGFENKTKDDLKNEFETNGYTCK